MIVVMRRHAAEAAAGKKMTVMVLVRWTSISKIGMEVNVMKNVRELRKVLERLESLG